MVTVGNRIAHEIRRQGFRSPRAFALAKGIDPSTLSRLLSGVTNSGRVATLQQVAGALGVSIDRLIRPSRLAEPSEGDN